jgi:hypothetical protein
MSNTHEVNIVRVGPILPHPNADKLELTHVNGYQIVIGKGSFKEGDLAVYIQPDSVVPQTEAFKFIWEPYSPLEVNNAGESFHPAVPEKRRRITVKRLRKEWSEGLLMPMADTLPLTDTGFGEGDDVAGVLGITHYVPEFDVEETKTKSAAKPQRKYPRTLRGWFFWSLRKLGFRHAGGQSYAQEVSFDTPVYDVNALKNAKRETFRTGEDVFITEKIHGSNARYVFIADGKPNPLNPAGKFYVGSRTQWVIEGPNVWWNAARQHPEIEDWCTSNPGKVLYGEVGPTQKGFRYGAEEGETFFFAFDTYDIESKEWNWPGNEGFTLTAPLLYTGPYSEHPIEKLVDGKSSVPNAKNIREGIVISSKERRLKLKVVSNAYLEKDNQ